MTRVWTTTVFTNSVPQGRPNLAQDASRGHISPGSTRCPRRYPRFVGPGRVDENTGLTSRAKLNKRRSVAFPESSLYRQQRSGAPYLARFSRDVGYHGTRRTTLSVKKRGEWRFHLASVAGIPGLKSETWGTLRLMPGCIPNPSNLWACTPVLKKHRAPLTSNLERLYLLEQTISAGDGSSRNRALSGSCR
jgi:hypothetical protein